MAHDLVRETSYVPRYAMVGAVTFCIDVSVFTILVLMWGREHVALATLCGGTCGYFVNFFGHRLFTFRNEAMGRKFVEIPLHAGMKFGNQGIRAGLMHLLVVILGVHVAIAYLGVGALTSMSNFVLSRWIFMRQNPIQFFRMLGSFKELGFSGAKNLFLELVHREYVELKVRLRR